MKHTSIFISTPGFRLIFCLTLLLNFTSEIYCFGNQSREQDTLQVRLTLPTLEVTEVGPFLSGVQGMAMDNNGVLYYADSYSKADDISKVYILRPPYTGIPEATNIEGISITGLMWMDEKLYVSFLNTNEIIIYDKNLEFLESRPVNSPLNFANDGHTTFVLTYDGEIGVITDNRVRIFIKDLTSPFDIIFSKKESLWISQKGSKGAPGRVAEIGYAGTELGSLDLPLKEPAGLGMDHEGNLYIADKGDNKIYMVTWEGETYLVSDKYASPVCFVTMPDGRMMVNTEDNGGSLLIISMTR